MYFLITEIELAFLGVASIGVMFFGAFLVTLIRLVASNKVIMQNQQKQNELLITMSNLLGTKSEEEIRKMKQESIESRESRVENREA